MVKNWKFLLGYGMKTVSFDLMSGGIFSCGGQARFDCLPLRADTTSLFSDYSSAVALNLLVPWPDEWHRADTQVWSDLCPPPPMLGSSPKALHCLCPAPHTKINLWPCATSSQPCMLGLGHGALCHNQQALHAGFGPCATPLDDHLLSFECQYKKVPPPCPPVLSVQIAMLLGWLLTDGARR